MGDLASGSLSARCAFRSIAHGTLERSGSARRAWRRLDRSPPPAPPTVAADSLLRPIDPNHGNDRPLVHALDADQRQLSPGQIMRLPLLPQRPPRRLQRPSQAIDRDPDPAVVPAASVAAIRRRRGHRNGRRILNLVYRAPVPIGHVTPPTVFPVASPCIRCTQLERRPAASDSESSRSARTY